MLPKPLKKTSSMLLCAVSLSLFGMNSLLAQSSLDPWNNSEAVRIGTGQKSSTSNSSQNQASKSQTSQSWTNQQSNDQPRATRTRDVSQQSSERRFFFEVTPTYLRSEATGPWGLECNRDFYGAFFSFGKQFNEWHKLQLDLGVLYSTARKSTFDSESEYQFLCPALLTYNFCIPIGKSNFSLNVGPSIGGVEIVAHSNDSESGIDYVATYAAGGNISLNIALSKRFYTQLGVRYLYMGDGGDPDMDNGVDIYSASLTCGWRF